MGEVGKNERERMQEQEWGRGIVEGEASKE